LLLEGQKMSKSRGRLIDTAYLAENYPIDAIRFYLALNMPEQKELNFTWRDFIETNNKILVGTIGNFVHRVLSFSQANFNGHFDISEPEIAPEVKKIIRKTIKEAVSHLEKGEFRFSLQEIVELATFGNQYIDKNQAWNLIRKNPEKAKKIVKNSLCIIDSLRLLLYPFLPESAEKLNNILGYKEKISGVEGKNQWFLWKIPKRINLFKNITPIFPKIDEKNIEKELNNLNESKC